MEYATLNNGVKMPMAKIGALDKQKRYYYASTTQMLKAYVNMVPDVDGQK